MRLHNRALVAVILSLVMALAIVGCSGNANAPAPTTHKDNASFTVDGTVIPGSDPNPWQECGSLEEAGKLAGFSFTAPETVDGYTERYIAAIENEIAQVIFSNGDDSELYFRKGVGGDDISGDYNTYDVTEKQTIDGHTVLCKGNDGLMAKVNEAIAAALADGSMDQFVAEANELAAGDTASLVDGEIVADEK